MKKIIISVVIFSFIFSFLNFSKAKTGKLYISNNNVYYDCPDGAMAAPSDLGININSVKIIDNRFFTDKNKVYTATTDSHSQICSFWALNNIDPATFQVLNSYYQKDKNNIYYTDNYWGWNTPRILEGADVNSFIVLSERYAKDKNYGYYTYLTKQVKMTGVDVSTLEALKEDEAYAVDKNNTYLHGKILSDQGETISNNSLYNWLKGKIILRVESNGEAYYVSHNAKKMYFLSRPVIAFHVMREQGIGITNEDLEKIPVADNCPSYTPGCDNVSAHDFNFAKVQKGKTFLQVEENGEAWYVNPDNYKRYFLGRPTDAFNVMRELGLGISNNNFNSLIK